MGRSDLYIHHMPTETIRIASYNIRKARGLDQKRSPNRVLDVVNALGADVVVLQEADKRLGDRPTSLPRTLIASETDFDVVEIADAGRSIGWHRNAVLLRKGLAREQFKRLTYRGWNRAAR